MVYRFTYQNFTYLQGNEKWMWIDRNILIFGVPPREYWNKPEYTGKGPNYTSNGGEKIFAADARHDKKKSRDEETNQSN